MVPFMTKKTQRTIVMCAVDCSLTGMKHFFIYHFPTLKKVCKVTFDFKYTKKIISTSLKTHVNAFIIRQKTEWHNV